MRAAVRAFCASGAPVYAECGGLMYLGQSIDDLEGNEYVMAGAIPVASQIASPRLSLGYRTVTALNDGPLLRQGEEVRGHEFHWSVLKSGSDAAPAYAILEMPGRREGYQRGRLLASYVHLHLGARPQLAPRFVANCANYLRKPAGEGAA
jgi:cobyrinic acid a,c-diamide synthase